MGGNGDLSASQQMIERLDRQLKLNGAAEQGGQHSHGDGGDHRDHRQLTETASRRRGGVGGRSFSLGRTSAMQSISRITSSGERYGCSLRVRSSSLRAVSHSSVVTVNASKITSSSPQVMEGRGRPECGIKVSFPETKRGDIGVFRQRERRLYGTVP